jgi:integrase/recombinase XerC
MPGKVLTSVLDDIAASTSVVSLAEARRFAERQLRERDQVTELSGVRIFALWDRFERFALAHGVESVSGVTPELAADFVHARTSNRGHPSNATMHLRRAAVRLLFKVLREFRLLERDPTLDLVLPPRSGLAVRPLTDEEVDLCRWAALSSLVATSKPAFWALGEAGASTLEIARVTVADLDVEEGRVWLSGGPRTDARMAPLTNWGAKQLGRRLRSLGCDDPSRLVAFERQVDEHTGRSRAGQVLQAVMGKAGLGAEPDLKPRSVTAWVGSRVLRDTGRIDEAARRLGLRSLDLTAELVGFEWRPVAPEDE